MLVEVLLKSMANTKTRPTADLVVLAITAVVSIVIVLLAVGLIVLAFIEPNADHPALANVLTDLVTVMLGALIGFIGGRATVKAINGHSESQISDE